MQIGLLNSRRPSWGRRALALILATALSSLEFVQIARADDFGGAVSPDGPPPEEDPGCLECCDDGSGEGGDIFCPNGIECGKSDNQINFWDGRERHEVADIVIPGYFPITFVRSYDNQISYDSVVGYGWTHNYDLRAFRDPDGNVYLRAGGAARRKFARPTSCGGTACPPGTQYLSDKGEFANTLLEGDAGTLIYIDPNGTESLFDTYGRLASITDVRGAKLQLTYASNSRYPIQGRSKYTPDPNALGIVALEYRLTEVREWSPTNADTQRYIQLQYDPSTGRLRTITDHDGRMWQYTQTTSGPGTGNLESVQLPQVGATPIEYTYGYVDANDPHNLTSVDEGFVKFTVDYEDTGTDKVESETTATGTTWTPTYGISCVDLLPGAPSCASVQTTVTHPGGNPPPRVSTWKYAFDVNGSPLLVVDPGGNRYEFPREPARHRTTGSSLSKVVGGGPPTPSRTSDVSNRDLNGNITSMTVTDSQTGEQLAASATYAQNTASTVRTSIGGGVSHGMDREWLFNARGYPKFQRFEKQIKDWSGSTPIYRTIEFEPDTNFQVQAIKYPGGDVDSFGYTKGYLTNFNGETYVPDVRGNVLTRTDRLGRIWTYTYDDLDRIETVLYPDGAQDIYTYLGLNLDKRESGKKGTIRGRVDHFGYDALGRVTSVSTEVPSGSTNLVTVTTIVRDSDGNPISIKDAVNRETKLTYDAMGRLDVMSVGDALLSERRTLDLDYDMYGNVTRLWDGGTRQSTFQQRIVRTPGHVTQVADGNGRQATLTVDALGARRGIRDPLGHDVVENRDLIGRMTSFAAWGFPTTQYTYTGRDEIDTRVLPGSRVVDHTYNSRGQLTDVDLAGTDAIHLTPNADDRIERVWDQDSDLAYQWDQVGRLKRETNQLTGRWVEMDYDGRGRRTHVRTSDGVDIQYDYTDLDHLDRVLLNGVEEADYTTDNSGFVTKVRYRNNVEVDYVPDSAGAIKSQEAKYYPPPRDPGTAVPLNRIDYLERDASGFVRHKRVELRLPDGSSTIRHFHYAFDNTGRLQEEWIKAADDSTTLSKKTFGYDYVGNRTSVTVESGPTYTYNYDAASYRLLSVTGGATTTSFTYHDNGRGQVETHTENGVPVTYQYDLEGRVTSIDTPTSDSNFVLSADGRRLSRTVDGQPTQIAYDGLNVLREYPASGNAVTFVADSRLDSQFLKSDGVSSTYFLRDALTGSVIQTVDANGSVAGSQLFEAFGEPFLQNGTTGPFGFAGRPREPGTSNYDFRERQYSPSAGRFLSVDPLRPDGYRVLAIGGPGSSALAASGIQTVSAGLGVGLDLGGYTFASNNPVMLGDPTGEFIPLIIGLLWLLDKGLTLWDIYDVAKTFWDCSKTLTQRWNTAWGKVVLIAGAALVGGLAWRLTKWVKNLRAARRAAADGGAAVGGMRRLRFDAEVSAQRHTPGVARPGRAAGPINGQEALDTSITFSGNSRNRVGVDYAEGQFVVFMEHDAGEFHGHVRTWEELNNAQRAALRKAGMATGKGEILTGVTP